MNDTPQPQLNQPQPAGPFAAIIIVVLLLAIGGIYFLITQEMKLHSTPSQETSSS